MQRFLVLLLFLFAFNVRTASPDEEKDPQSRRIPSIPLKGERLRVIIDSDAKNEIDDQWAITLAILSPERFAIEGFVAANYGRPDAINRSFNEIQKVLKLAGMEGKYPVKRGSHPLQYRQQATESEGVDFIIDKAMQSTPDDPLWVVGLGAATDMASAYLKEPKIIDRVIAFWHFRTHWPEKCINNNVICDARAARLVFHSPLSFVLFDAGTYLYCPIEESERFVKPFGKIGQYLHEYRYDRPNWIKPSKFFPDLGDIAALLDPELACWQVVDCPDVDQDLDYLFTRTKGKILRCYHVDRDKTFELFYNKLKNHYSGHYR